MSLPGHELLVDRYELRAVLGSGGIAEVRDGWDTRLDRAVAVKLMHPAFNAQPGIRGRFEDEARSAAKLSHPKIVAVYDFGEHDSTPFIVMERLPGQTLGDVIARGPMPPERVRAMLSDVLAALTVAHAAGVLHRDIKPGNILISATGDNMKVAERLRCSMPHTAVLPTARPGGDGHRRADDPIVATTRSTPWWSASTNGDDGNEG